jgi:hypothetical protein
MRRASLSLPLAFVGIALLCTAGPAQALGFGRSINASYLGQPLNFAATVRLEADETLPRECVAAEVQSGDNKLPSICLARHCGTRRERQRTAGRVSTQTQIDEPVVTVTVTAGCLPRLTRSFVTLMDPPGLNLAQGGASSSRSLAACAACGRRRGAGRLGGAGGTSRLGSRACAGSPARRSPGATARSSGPETCAAPAKHSGACGHGSAARTQGRCTGSDCQGGGLAVAAGSRDGRHAVGCGCLRCRGEGGRSAGADGFGGGRR